MWDDKGKEISIMQFQQQYMDILCEDGDDAKADR